MVAIYGNRWKNLGSLGEGGQSFVYRVSDLTETVAGEHALKRLKKMDRVDRFRREVEILRSYQHENIIRLIDAQVKEYGEEKDNYLVMPVAEHGDLAKRLQIYTGHIGSVIEVVLQIARALDFIHAAGIVHRDIKPGNILFPDAGHKVWVADFGLAFDPDATWKSPIGEIVGPRGFTAPELESGDPGNATPSADVYSLGRLIFFMLTGGRHIDRGKAFDTTYDTIFAKGERYTNLRLLLNRMVAEQSHRIAQMKEVIAELERLEKWEENAVSLVLSKASLAAFDKLKQDTAEKLAIRAENAAARESEEASIKAVTSTIETLLDLELGKLKDHVAADGVLKAWVLKDKSPNGGNNYRVQTGPSTALLATGGVAFGIQLLDDLFQTRYTLFFLVCSEQKLSIQTVETRLSARDPNLAVLPVFTQSHPEHRDRVQFLAFFSGPSVQYGVSDPAGSNRQQLVARARPQVQLHQTFQNGLTRILRFKASQWPAAQAELTNLIDGALHQFIQHARSPYKAFGA